VAEVSGRNPPISVLHEGLGAEYTGDNSCLLAELGDYKFIDMREAIGELYGWYAACSVNASALSFDC
jgi:hypothetical protein